MSFEFADVSLSGWVLAGALVALGAVLLVIARGRVRWTARMIANAALCLALAFVLSYIKLFDLPQGGAVTAASLLPIVAFAYSYGLAPGLVVGVVFFAEYAEGTGLSPFVYSVSYNSFVFVDMAICAVVMAFPQVRRALRRMTER